MSKSIAPGKDVFQYAIRYLPTGKYLKKTPGSSFYETDIPSVYVSPKVAMKSLETSFKYIKRFDPQDCKIVKFVIRMEEVKDPTPEEIEFQKELDNLNRQRNILGEQHWCEVDSERGKWEIFQFIKHLNKQPLTEDHSLHCFSKTYSTFQGTYQLLWEHGQKESEMPISISRAVEYNWEQRIQELKNKYGVC